MELIVFLLRKEAARYLTDKGLPVSANTLQKNATTGGGPEYQIFGNRSRQHFAES